MVTKADRIGTSIAWHIDWLSFSPVMEKALSFASIDKQWPGVVKAPTRDGVIEKPGRRVTKRLPGPLPGIWRCLPLTIFHHHTC